MDTGEFPGYEFEVPRGPGSGPRHGAGYDSLQQLRYPPPAPARPRRSPLLAAGHGVLTVMRRKNWLMGLAAPLLAAIAVGIAAVVITGGGSGGGTAPSALAAGFPPARLAGAGFTGPGSGTRVVLSAIGASSGTEVTAGSAQGGPALWISADGGADWSRARLSGAAALTGAGTGQLTAVAHGPAGWLAVGTTLAGGGGALVASSADARTWTAARGIAGASDQNVTTSAAAAGSAGYVVVGHRSAGPGRPAVAAAWYTSETGSGGSSASWPRISWPRISWHGAAVTAPGSAAGEAMNAVTAAGGGFTAVGASGSRPAAWLSAAGRTWRQVTLPTPAGADRAALDYVAAKGTVIVAAGTDFTASGASRSFAEVSADGGRAWTVVRFPVPATGPGTGTTVTALTAAGGGFTATGTYVTKAGPEVVVWALQPGQAVTAAAAWSAVTPQGTGLSGASAENAITALTADGATLTGVGFTAPLSKSGNPGSQRPTLWQSPIRY